MISLVEKMQVYLYLFMILIVVHNGKSVMASGPHQGSPAHCELSEHIRHISHGYVGR